MKTFSLLNSLWLQISNSDFCSILSAFRLLRIQTMNSIIFVDVEIIISSVFYLLQVILRLIGEETSIAC